MGGDTGDVKPAGPKSRKTKARAENPEHAQGQPLGPLESLFQEAIRRATALGLSGFFLTEEAVRRALTDTVPQEWVDYVSRQSEDVRRDTVDRLVREFGLWLRTLDLSELLRNVLEDYEISAQIDISADRKRKDPVVSLKVAPHRK
jgi:hypothetical protein